MPSDPPNTGLACIRDFTANPPTDLTIPHFKTKRKKAMIINATQKKQNYFVEVGQCVLFHNLCPMVAEPLSSSSGWCSRSSQSGTETEERGLLDDREGSDSSSNPPGRKRPRTEDSRNNFNPDWTKIYLFIVQLSGSTSKA